MEDARAMGEVPPGTGLRFGSFHLDLGRAALLGPDGAAVPLRPRSFDVLCHLLRHAGRIVSRDELLDAVWRGVLVTEDSVTQCIAEVRRALGPEAEGMLRTVPRRGYLFEATVTPVASAEPVPRAAEPALPANSEEAGARPRPWLPLPELPSLAVLPFANIGGDATQDHLAEGFADEIITALARLHGLFVIARDSSFAYGSHGVDVRRVGRELGVRYVLGGSVHPGNGRVRIAGRLVEAETGRHVWADRFEGELAEILALQDRVAEAVAGAVEPSLRRAEVARAQAKPTESLDAYGLYLRAVAQANANTRAGLDAALGLVHRALALDPDYALAKAFGAWCCIRRFNERVAVPEDAELGLAWAREVAAVARGDAVAQAWAGHAIARFGLDLDQARGCTDRAVALCPGSALVLTQSAWVLTYCGEATAAIGQFSRALRLNPLDAEVDAASGLGMAQLAAGEDEAALGSAMLGVCDARPHGTAFRVAIVALVRLGRLAEARAMAGRFMRLFPAFRIRRRGYMPHFRDTGFVAGYVGALLLAGVPEDAGGPAEAPPGTAAGS